MNIVMTALNAKYIHSSLALRSLFSYCTEYAGHLTMKEFTINNEESFIVSELYKLKPDVLCFSCYIWNIKMIKSICEVFRKVMPGVTIVLGGPEVSYEYDHLVGSYADIICVGEGEITFHALVKHFVYREGELGNVLGIAFLRDGKVVFTGANAAVSLDEIPFIYDNHIYGLGQLENKIIYYESSRGCPFSCQYCLSSVEAGVRFLSLERVFSDMDFFLTNNARQVKFVDRTFNCNPARAIAIWRYLVGHDNGVTNFHFEISADILDEQCLEAVKDARVNLFQFEVGVQSTNLNTLEDIKRKHNISALFSNVRQIKKFGNINLHLDLIAGLPDESYGSFQKSFNEVYVLYPEQLQLGFLKLLRGSGLRKDAVKFGIVYDENAPYEFLFTRDLCFDDALRLREIESTVENYYNSNKFIYTLRYIITLYAAPFDFYEELAAYWVANKHHRVFHNKVQLFSILYEFCLGHAWNITLIKDLLKFDLMICDNAKTLPKWLVGEEKNHSERTRRFYGDSEKVYKFIPHLSGFSSSQLYRMCNIEAFQYDVNDFGQKEKYYLFDYNSKNERLNLSVSRAEHHDITEYI